MRVLIVEDNPKMAAALQRGLRESGFAVDVASTGAAGEEAACTGMYDVIILDVMLPDRDGTDLCRSLREKGVEASVLMLTALASTEDRVRGLDSGADDYLAKPFEFEELLARIRALLRSGHASEARILRCEDLELDVYSRAARRGDRKVVLSNREFGLLEFLMRNPQRVLTRAQIGEKVWDMQFEPTSNVVDVYISSLRKKLDRGHPTELIHTVKGVGYRLGPSPAAKPVERQEEPAST